MHESSGGVRTSTQISTDVSPLLMWISGFSGASYGDEMPVKSDGDGLCERTSGGRPRRAPLISPDRAFLYRPFGSRCLTTSSDASAKTSMNGILASSWSLRALSRSARNGEMKDVMAMQHESAKSLATYAITVN